MQNVQPLIFHVLRIDESKSAEVFVIKMIFGFCFGLCDLTPLG